MEALLDGLDEAQRRAVTIEPGGPLAILAGAGSGKTLVLTRRVAWRIAEGHAQASHTLVATFTRRAAGELAHRLGTLGVREQITCGTLHGVARQVLQQRWADTAQRPWAILDRPDRVLGPIVSELGLRATVSEVAADIDWARARLVTPDHLAQAADTAGRRLAAPPERAQRAYVAYEAAKRSARVIDFNDLLSMCIAAADRDRAFAEVLRWRFRHLYVDEFQDLNPLQFRLLSSWMSPTGDLCVVGDPQQAIYGWNGADPQLLTGFTERFPESTVVRLDLNHRCPAPILEAAAAVLDQPQSVARIEEGTPPGLHGYPDPLAEAAGIATLVRQARAPGGRWRSIAVLTRTHEQLVAIEAALDAAGIPTVVRSRVTRPLHPAVRAWLAEPVHLRTPLATTLADLETRLEDSAPGDRGEEHRALTLLATSVQEFLAEQYLGTVTELGRWLERSAAAALHADGVELATFHAAKGLEWSTVVVAGVEAGIVPHGSARTAAAQDEERRLLYVAMTRARRRLHVTWCERRDGARRGPSRLLERVRAVVADSDQPPVPPPPTPRSTPASTAPSLRDILVAWRARAAAAGRCPEAAVLPDEVLDAVAASRPRRPEDLSTITGFGPVKRARYGDAVMAVISSADPSPAEGQAKSTTTGA